jgi:hypothetical protein
MDKFENCFEDIIYPTEFVKPEAHQSMLRSCNATENAGFEFGLSYEFNMYCKA